MSGLKRVRAGSSAERASHPDPPRRKSVSWDEASLGVGKSASASTSTSTRHALSSYAPLSDEYKGKRRPLRIRLGSRNESLLSTPTSPRFPGTRWFSLRAIRSPRRLVTLALAMTVFLSLWALSNESEDIVDAYRWVTRYEEPVCRFVSPVEAYYHDLERIRGLYPGRNISRTTASHAHAHTHAHHMYSPTGHLVLSSDSTAPHPIPQLLALGETRWEELLSRQSRTLGEAVTEYKRRYARLPPKGFDKWWQFATEHNVVLPDEYDRINTDLSPFWGLPKSEMRKRLHEVEDMLNVFTLNVKDGNVSIEVKDESAYDWGGTKPRTEDAAGLLQTFADYLPNLRATFSIFDEPQVYLSWARRQSLVKLGLMGHHTTHLTEEDDGHVRLARSCPPDSNLRSNASMYEGKSFVYDTIEASDFCLNPYLVPLHGLTIAPHTPASHPRPQTRLLPLFSLAKTVINSDILVTPLDQFFDKVRGDVPWDKKRDSRLAWRGSPTGISMMTKDIAWRDSHRVRLHRFANNMTRDPLEFIVPDFGQGETPEESAIRQEREVEESAHHQRSSTPIGFKNEVAPQNVVLRHFFDMKLAGRPIQCSQKDGTCDDMEREIRFAGFQKAKNLYNHKFLLDIDGNGWSGRFRRLMSSNSVVIKTGIFTEWYQSHLIPWFMYVPAKLDFSDLADTMSFFAGSPSHPEIAFDATAKALAMNGQCFVQRMFRYDDLQAYMMRLFLEYARIIADEGVDMDFHYDPGIHGEPGREGESDAGVDVDEDEEEAAEPQVEAESLPEPEIESDQHFFVADDSASDFDSLDFDPDDIKLEPEQGTMLKLPIGDEQD